MKSPFSPDAIAARRKDLQRIAEALEAAAAIMHRLERDPLAVTVKGNGDSATAADLMVNERLFELLPGDGDGWLSEETADDQRRLGKRRIWVVDPLDGTREYIAGIPEYCISIGLVEDGEAVAGGICNPATREVFLGSRETGVTLNGVPVPASSGLERQEPLVLASRSEASRGEWDGFRGAPFTVRPVGSVAYKLALVAAGLADGTWTTVPKHEWDVAAGVALVLAAHGMATTLAGTPRVFNLPDTLVQGLIAVSTDGQERLRRCLAISDTKAIWESFRPVGDAPR
jgi:myo-inositol-1(or 4)-monophosphatase